MPTVVAIHQPQYLPWVPYIDKADRSDVFVYLDNVQYQKNGLQNRNQIKTAQGAQWLTVPVQSSLDQHIRDIRIADNRWQRKHLLAIEQNYSRAPYFSLFNNGLRQLLEAQWDYLCELNIAITEWLFSQFGVTCRRVRASELGAGGVKDELVIEICKAVGANIYLSGQGAKQYQDEAKFQREGIELRYQSYQNMPYEQLHPKAGFVADLSSLDLLLNTGERAWEVMRAGRL